MKVRPDYYSEQNRNLVYADILTNLTERQKAVYQMILEFGPISTERIAELMGVYPNYITGRIKELRDELQIIEFAGAALSEKSGAKVSLWKVKKFDPQMAFNF